MAACDCYVSLHRAEGFGLTLAEAMAIGKPAIATGYSGNVDFMNEQQQLSRRLRRSAGSGPNARSTRPRANGREPSVEHAARADARGLRRPRGGGAARRAGRARTSRERCRPQATGAAMRARLQELARRSVERRRAASAGGRQRVRRRAARLEHLEPLDSRRARRRSAPCGSPGRRRRCSRSRASRLNDDRADRAPAWSRRWGRRLPGCRLPPPRTRRSVCVPALSVAPCDEQELVWDSALHSRRSRGACRRCRGSAAVRPSPAARCCSAPAPGSDDLHLPRARRRSRASVAGPSACQ